ncbi:PREDICTED: uncharacterized protein LOC106100518 [Papilio polytes]|uniref:uncharacterized protein LOC106100518 n=1 Tax=Papilio polytes TaxID=76194 RepID=UPI00067631A0|nr:PREDICTED: uncharacterized protein LOC106100518 [Papilio polytes]
MSLLKVNGVIQLLGKKTTKMLYSSSSKTNDTSSDGCNTTKETNDDLKDSSSPLDTLTYSLSTFYNTRKYGHALPTNNVSLNFDPLYGIPTGVFRETCGESLGAGTGCGGSCYQNPEYFSYHHMSYYDLHTALRAFRKVSPQTGRKK